MSQPRILLYATASCPHCASARAALEAAGEAFEERDPMASADALRDLVACAASAVVPTVVVGGRALVGFDAERLDQMLREPPIDPGVADDYTEEELSGSDDDLKVPE
jgi:glutaredoxin